ncbi:MAG: hypothetical protein RSB69_06955 [Odoribacter sp.]
MMKLKIFILIILFFCFCKISKGADGVAGRDSVEVNLYNARVVDEAGKKIYYVDIRLRRLTDWKKVAGGRPLPVTDLFGFDIFLERDLDKFVAAIPNGTKPDLDVPKFTWSVVQNGIYGSAFSDELGHCYSVVSNSDLHPNTPKTIMISCNSPLDAMFGVKFPDNSSYITVGTLKWELKSGIKGDVGVNFTNHSKLSIVSANGDLYLNKRYTGSGIVSIGEVSTKPADPIFATGESAVCPNTSATYTIGAAKNATGYEWFVASDAAGTTKITDNNMCVITPAANGLSATVQWKNLSTGNYWVCVKAKNSATPIEYSGIVSYAVNIKPRPTVTLAVAKGGVVYADKKTIEECAGTLLNFSVAGTATGYVWSGTGVSGNGSAKNVTLANATMLPISEKYKVIGTLDGCSAADSALISVKPIPTGLYFNPPLSSSYARGAQLQTSIMAASGVTLSSYQWTSPVSATTSSIATTVDGMVGSTKTVAVEVTNNYGCKAQKSTSFKVERGLDLALTPFYGESVICTNGVVLLKAMATGLTSATYTYKWYSGTTASGTPLQTTSNVSEAIDYYEAKTAGDYFVEVASHTGLRATASIVITTKNVSATSVTVLPEIVAATPDKKVVLMATTSAGAPTWKWIPESKLNDAAQSTLQYPLTAAVTNGFVDYKVYMKDASGCVSTGTTKVKAVTNNLALKVEPSTASLCLGNKVQLKATLSGGSGSGPTYSWAPTTGLNQSNISNPIFTATLFEDAGNYIVKAQRENEVVTAQVNIQISNQQAPVLQKVSDIFCVGQTLSVTDQNRNTNLSYNWKLIESGKETDLTVHTPSINISTAGQYTIKVVGVVPSTCASDTLTIPIEVRQIQLSQSVNPSPEYLEGATIVSTATATGGWEPYIYSWTSPIPQKLNTSENTYTILGASQSTYGFAVSVKDNKGCEISATPVEVRKKTGGYLLTVDTMYAYCDGGMAMMKAVATGGTPGSGYTYEWRLQGSNTVLSTTDTYLEVDPATHTTFNVTVKDQSTPSLMRNETFLLTDKKLTEKAPVLTTPGTITIFTGGKAIVSASSDKTISQWNWQPEDKMTEPHKQYAQTIALTAEQQYTVYAIDTKGCISQKATEKVSIVSEGNIGGFDLSIIANAQMCAGAKQTLSVDISQSSPTYSWVSTPNLFDAAEKTKATPEINPMAAGSYEISVTVTAGGVSNTAVKTIEVTSNPVPVLAMNFKTKVCEGDVVTVTPSSLILNGVYTWYVDGVQQAGSTNQLPLTINGTHTIKVSGTTEQGCVGEQEETRTINEQPVLSWIPALTNPVEMYSSLVVTAVPAKKTAADYTYNWAVTPTGTPAANVYTVITKLGDTKIDLSVVATDKTTTCQSKPLTGSVTVAGGLGADLLAEGLVCSGGSAKLVVSNITGDVGPYTYEWIKTGVPGTVLGRDSILMVPVVKGDSYTVTIKKQGTEKKVIKDIVLAPEAGKTAPLATACADITIPVNSQAVLTAKASGTAPFIYTWLPVSKLKSPVESHFQSPTTASLTGDTPYEVYVSDKVGCISAKDELTVKVNSLTALRVSIEPDMELCLGNTVHYRAIVTNQNGQTVNIVQSEWKALQGISSKTLLTGDYKPTKAGVDTIVVVVSNGTLTATAKRVVKIKSYNVPTLDFANSVKCDKETLQLTSQSVFNNYNWIIQQGTTIVKHTGGNHQFTAPGTYTVKVYGTTAQCVSDTLEKEVMINPIPSIQKIQTDSVCGKAKLVAITTDADRWTWTDLTASGVTMTTKDSLCYYKTLAMSADYNGTLQVASNAGCESPTATAFNGTVYSLPAISMLPLKTSVYPNTAVDIEATLTPAIAYTLEWEKANLVASGQGTNKIKTKPLSTAVDPYLFIIKVTNTANTACKISDTSTISVDNKDFAISFGKDTLDICQDVKGHFAVTAVNNKYDPITYAYTSDYPGFDAAMAAVKKESFDYTFANAGIYRIRVKATNANTPSPDVRKDSIIVRVNPTPTLDITSPGVGGSYSLCDNKGKLEVAMKATGTGGWTLHYRLASAKKQESFTTAAHTMILSEGGEFYTDSIVDSKRCKKDYSASMIGFTVKDDIPRLALKSTTGITKCQGTTTDLNIEITNASALDYALTLYYKHGPTQVQYSFTDASTKFADDYVGTYTIDSIVSARQCAYKLTANRQVTVSEYTETVPLLTLTDKGNKSFCEGNSVNIPLQISNGGKPAYTITYALAGGSDKTIVLPTSGNINVTENGPLVIKGFADGNGCGNYTANETIQITKNANPVAAITTTERLLCGGTLDLGITLSQGKAPYNLHYTLNGVAKPVNTYSTAGAAVWTIAEKGRFDIVKVEDVNGCSVAGTAVTGGPTIDVDSFRLHVKFNGSDAQCATADAKLKFDFTGTDWAQVVGPLKVEYDYTPLVGSVQHLQITKTKTEAQGGSVLLSGIQQGTYTLVKITDLKTDGVGTACEGILPAVAAEKSVTVIKAPVVEIDSVDFALYQGDKFKLGIKDLNISDFIYSWQKLPDAPTTATAPDYKVTGTMGTQDMKYVLKGSNKNVASCFNTDTVRIYKIPDPLVIAIDTNLTRNDLKITWNTTNPNDVVTGYRLMHNLWDGYAIETQYTPKITSTLGTKYEIAKNDLDTLEFFYTTAYRSILMNGTTKTFYSKESDTVGYYHINMMVNSAEIASNNLFATYFDLTKIGIKTSEDLFYRAGVDNLSYIRKFQYLSQEWLSCYSSRGSIRGIFDIGLGEVLQIEALKPFSFTFYGKLPEKYKFDVKRVDEDKSNNLYFFQPWRMDLTEAKQVFGEIEQLSYIRYWQFKTQEWISCYESRGSIRNSFVLRPVLMPLQFELKMDYRGSILWK